MKTKEVKKDYEEIINSNDKKINVLVTGVSGCGKSTLINSILEEDQAITGSGSAITKEIKVYQNETLPFRMIDTVGFEYGFLKQVKIKHDLEKWSKNAIKDKKTENIIHVVWFCVDGTVKRIQKEVLDSVHHISKMWKNVPIIVVFTKSYSQTEMEENKQMFRNALDSYKKKNELNIRGVVSVVAKPYPISDKNVIPSFGLDTLIETTNACIPEAKKIATSAIQSIDLQIKKNMAYGILTVSTISASAVGAIPIPVPDASVLVPLQTSMLKSIASTFRINNKSLENEIMSSILKAGATTMAAKTILNVLKANPAINIGADLLNATVAGVITFISGEIEIITFENVYKGNWDLEKVDINENIIQLFKDRLPDFISILNKTIESESGKISIDTIGKLIASLKKDQKK